MSQKSIRADAFRSWSIGAILVCALSSLGCRPKTPNVVPVTGKVLLDGKPLATGSVLTQPGAGRGSKGFIQDGAFELSTFAKGDGAVLGTHKVGVVAYESHGTGGPEATMGKLLVPERYINPETSGLTIEVTADGPNEPVLELTSP